MNDSHVTTVDPLAAVRAFGYEAARMHGPELAIGRYGRAWCVLDVTGSGPLPPAQLGAPRNTLGDAIALADARIASGDYRGLDGAMVAPSPAPLWRERPALVSVWTDRDTSEAGPTVEDAPATVTIEPGDGSAPVLHVMSDGPAGLWTVALTLTPDTAAALARDLDAIR